MLESIELPHAASNIKYLFFCFLILRIKPDTLLTHPYSLILYHLFTIDKTLYFLHSLL